ncbi:MAG: phosphatase PAP2 family protein [Prevotella sp.]
MLRLTLAIALCVTLIPCPHASSAIPFSCRPPHMELYDEPLATSFHAATATTDNASATTIADTISRHNAISRIARAAYIPLPLITVGLLSALKDKHDIGQCPTPLTMHDDGIADYLQFAPAAVMLSMKAAGIESRSSWPRMLAGGAASGILMAGMVKATKHIIDMPRPDASDMESTPSGHTAVAFMSATMLSEEYGHLSPWVSVGAYGVATATGLLRISQNKHWASDVMAGAGMGILATEIGYAVADALLGKWPSYTSSPSTRTWSYGQRPSGIGLYTGFFLPTGHTTTSDGETISRMTGTVTGIEGSWYITDKIGVSCHGSLSECRIATPDGGVTDGVEKTFMAGIGPCASITLAPCWRLGLRMMAAYVHYDSVKATQPDICIPSSGGMAMVSGIGLGLLTERSIETTLIIDHTLRPQHDGRDRGMTHGFIIGGKVMVRI